MLNIIRSQIYIMKRDSYYLWATAFTLMFFFVFAIETFENSLKGEPLSGSLIATVLTGNLTIAFFLLAVLSSSRIAGWDFTDKTLNYEVIYGHKRSSIYFGRAIVGIVSGLFRSGIVLLIAVVVPTVILGWGWTVPAGEMILRYFLVALEIIRLMSFVIMISFMAKSNVAGAFAGFAAGLIPMMILEFINIDEEKLHFISCFFSSLSISEATSFENYSTDYVLGNDVIVYLDRIGTNTAVLMSVIAVVCIVVYLLAGYAAFRKTDIH